MSVIKMTDLDLAGKRVLIRQDLNVPIKDGKVASDKRIRASMPTIEHCIKAGARVMLMSHLGRPTEGEPADEFSMKPVADYLTEALGKEVRLVSDYLDNAPELSDGDVVLLENVRFLEGEKKCDEALAKKMAAGAAGTRAKPAKENEVAELREQLETLRRTMETQQATIDALKDRMDDKD